MGYSDPNSVSSESYSKLASHDIPFLGMMSTNMLFDIKGDLSVGKTVYFGENFTFGDAATDSLTVTGTIAFSADTRTVGIDFADNCTTAIDIGTTTTGITFTGDATTAINLSTSCTPTTGILMQGAGAKAISITGANTTSGIDILATGSSARAIRIGRKATDGTSTDGSLQIRSGNAIDAEPSNNYLFGLFSKVAADETGATDELRSAWIRTRVNDGCHIGAATTYGVGVCGAEVQLKFYATSAATNAFSWQHSALWAQLETQGASGINFKSGSHTQCVLANVGLTTTTTIDSGATVAGVCINTNTATSGVTATGNFYGLHITNIGPASHLDFKEAIHIDNISSSVAIGFADAIDVPTIQTGTYQSTADGGVILTSSTTYNAAFLCDDSGSNIGASVRNVLGRTLLTASQSGGSIRSLMGQLKLLDAVNLATGVYTGVQGYVELAGDTTISSGAKASCMDISVEIASTKTLTIASGGIFAGLKIETTGAGTIANSGDCAAIYVDDGGTVTDWPVGIDLQNITTGIDIGSCTTGINFSGTCGTTCIDFSNATFATGDYAIRLEKTLAADVSNYWNYYITTIGSGVNNGWSINSYNKTVCSTDAASFNVISRYTKTSITKDIATVYNNYNHTEVTATGVTTGELSGVYSYLDIQQDTTMNSENIAAGKFIVAGTGDNDGTGGKVGIEIRTAGGGTVLDYFQLNTFLGANTLGTAVLGVIGVGTTDKPLLHLSAGGDTGLMFSRTGTAATQAGFIRVTVEDGGSTATKYIALYNSYS